MSQEANRRRPMHDLLQEVVAKVQNAYLQERSRGVNTPGDPRKLIAKWEADWPVIASFMVQNGISNYVEYFRLQFESRANRSVALSPRQCCGPVGLAKWKDARLKGESVQKTLATAFNFQKELLRTEIFKARSCQQANGWTDSETDDTVLLDRTSSLTALFRYCLAIKSGRPDIAEVFHRPALMQYVSSMDAYDHVWSDWIPSNLRMEAQELCGSLATG